MESIPLPQSYLTDKDWSSKIVRELGPYFIIPKAKYADFLDWIIQTFNIRELSVEDFKHPDLKHTVCTTKKEMSDCIWLLERNSKSKMFFEYDFRIGDFTSDAYEEEGWIVIGYNKRSDIFYSSSGFLDNVLNYYRGIDPKDLLNDSKELYPIHTALAYANNLCGVLAMYSAYLGIKTIHRIMHAEKLLVVSINGGSVTLSSASFISMFKSIFTSDIYMDIRYPQKECDRKYSMLFFESSGSVFQLYFGTNRLYFGRQRYYQLQKTALQFTAWLDEVLGYK